MIYNVVKLYNVQTTTTNQSNKVKCKHKIYPEVIQEKRVCPCVCYKHALSKLYATFKDDSSKVKEIVNHASRHLKTFAAGEGES